MSLYLAPATAAAAAAVATAAVATFPRRLVLPPSIDIRRHHPELRETMSPPPPLPPPLLGGSSRRMPAGAKHKAVVVLGATGTGKTRLAVDLALRFGGEVINSDKIQLYAGLDVATNKAGAEERAGVPHHLLGVVPRPDAEFTPADFRREARRAADAVTARGRVPVVAGGSNSYVEALVGDREFGERYECCFLWVDVQLPVLHGFVGRRVDDMLRRGLLEEVAAAFDRQRMDYSRGIWRAIGVPELDAYLRCGGEEGERERLLGIAVEEIKSNTRRLSCRQRGKIQRLARLWAPRVARVDATDAFRLRGAAADQAWDRLVAAPCADAVRAFLLHDHRHLAAVQNFNVFAPPAAAAAVV
ncbi:adenylate isopentenyltransferase 5, chloroplastic [Brachypodium distachyon]|uniref:adenylate dimethylallyltransferase (ADP/ATP-dependent) n=1 Tax=Brachypodium distachyon TaxID=15368 RepID=I1H2M9_BRADI|nr:adenylate isopentenyltransferase 5, chloroplastic [Brachypodium distachyon]KQK20362.1 hypothetical protein BRADI_1g54060v3 [Brachypodium distachyon]|eukprot:XP_003561295.1 adenylate isopentenyltransferase 5, chloroplastic [Brachypodium distachyon]